MMPEHFVTTREIKQRLSKILRDETVPIETWLQAFRQAQSCFPGWRRRRKPRESESVQDLVQKMERTNLRKAKTGSPQ